MVEKLRPIAEPYDDDVLEVLQAEWEKAKERLIEVDVTIPLYLESFARRMFFEGYIAALNTPPF